MKKLVALLLAGLMLFANIAALAEAPEGYPEVVTEMIQAEPTTITIYDYWSGDGARKAEPSEEEQATYDYRDWIESTYNVKVQQIQGGDWGTCAEVMINFNSAPDGTLNAYIVEPGKVASLIANGMAADWNYEFTAEKWNQSTITTYTKGDAVYGVSTGVTEPRGCVYFNKRILADAGIDYETIYDMQAAGTWTWAAWEDLLKKTTLDTDNDGVIDIYGVGGSGDDMYNLAVFGNGGAYFSVNEEGKLEPTMGSEAAIEAMNWGKTIQANYWKHTPTDAAWDWYKQAWKNGEFAFYVYQTYGGYNDNSEMADMEDEWGCVAFPVPNEGDQYIHVASENVTLIPSCYTAEEVQKIAFFYDLWTNPTPGYEDDDNWIGNKYNYTDDRAVDETYAMLREVESVRVNMVNALGTSNDVLGNSLLWGLAGGDPAALVEAGMPAWQAACDTYNGVAAQ
ncbi:MAG: hypothetical protein IJX84_01430 [Clostridia bacterium]|nr:hypothetical protein [Clostridia bacterium]MBQ8620607.1 hypothetical protein [Clostridia bacterium]